MHVRTHGLWQIGFIACAGHRQGASSAALAAAAAAEEDDCAGAAAPLAAAAAPAGLALGAVTLPAASRCPTPAPL